MSLWAVGRARPARPATSVICSTGGSSLRAALDGTPIYTPGFGRARRPRRTPARSRRARSAPTTTPTRCGTSSRPRASCTSKDCSPTTEMDAISADMDRAAPTYTEGDGRSWWARTADGDTRLVRMQGFDRESDGARALTEDARFLDLASIAGAGHEFGTQAREQPHRGAVQADRRHRGHLRHPVAQGLRHRPPLLRLLRPDRRHLGHRRRRGLGPAVGARGFAPRAGVVGHPPTRSRPARGSAADAHRRRHAAPELHDAHGAAARRTRTARHVQRLRPPAARRGRHRRARRGPAPGSARCAKARRSPSSTVTSRVRTRRQDARARVRPARRIPDPPGPAADALRRDAATATCTTAASTKASITKPTRTSSPAWACTRTSA